MAAHEVNVTSPSRIVEHRTNTLASGMTKQTVQATIFTSARQQHSLTMAAIGQFHRSYIFYFTWFDSSLNFLSVRVPLLITFKTFFVFFVNIAEH
ncbi:hypothetical protein KIN20_002253 [Parelaphostrongylus tenuis]|uniref:Uncharacterized protein n=1 Tax=Parelaphostrongylus tenuis TaxID=148309 RepID=A0AAD5MGI3_PARTN|nr:hypothetical protein KIN20_002253 [Parelaphostrongylus tenuis]